MTASSGASSTLRVRVWRRLRSLGALYLQNSVCLLPERPETTAAVARLIDDVRREGGEGRMLPITITDGAEEQAVIGRFRAERTDEYHEICSRTPAFLEEIASERRRGRATYTEVEESQADLERLRRWLHRVRTRDYFDAVGRREAEAAVEECANLLAAFEAEAFVAETATAEAPQAAAQPPLRLADES